MPYLARIHLSYKSKPVASGEIVTEYEQPDDIKRFGLNRAVRRLIDKKLSDTTGYVITKVEWVREIRGL